ncbi:MAG: hypothetical protein ACYC1P_12510 [Gaiellaceae bacterium]
MTERIGSGPWARLLASAVVPDESSSSAERGRRLAGFVEDLAVETGAVTARVAGCDVRLAAEPVPPRIWTAMTRYARNHPQLEAGVVGTAQSVHLEHLMVVDWEQPLVPPTRALARECSCDACGACEHVAAVAYAFALEIDRDPSALLRWRGCVPGAVEPEPEKVPPAPIGAGDWEAGELPALGPPRPLPVGAVLKRLGPSGIRIGARDLTDVLERAYASFAAMRGY